VVFLSLLIFYTGKVGYFIREDYRGDVDKYKEKNFIMAVRGKQMTLQLWTFVSILQANEVHADNRIKNLLCLLIADLSSVLRAVTFMLFQLCMCFKVLTCGENSLDRFALQGSVQRLEFHRVRGRRAQLCQAEGSCLRV